MKIAPLVFLVLTASLLANRDLPERKSPILEKMVEMSDLIVAGKLISDMGESDDEGDSYTRLYLEVTEVYKGALPEPFVDPFTGKVKENEKNKIAIDYYSQRTPTHYKVEPTNLIKWYGKIGIMFLEDDDGIFRNIDPWFSFHPMNITLDQKLKDLTSR